MMTHSKTIKNATLSITIKLLHLYNIMLCVTLQTIILSDIKLSVMAPFTQMIKFKGEIVINN